MPNPVGRPEGGRVSTVTCSMRARRGRGAASLRAIHRFRVSLEQRLDPAVGQVPHPAVQPLDHRLRLREGAVAHTLDAAADQVPSCNLHGSGDYESGRALPQAAALVADAWYSPAMPRIGASSHGESRLRMLRIVRRGDRHDPKDLIVSCRFEGAFAASFVDGRRDGLVPGEALKNLVHATARSDGHGEIEPFGLALCARVLSAFPRITRVRVEVAEQPWGRLEVGGKPQGRLSKPAGPNAAQRP
jgi:hypothetical protein